MSNIVLKLHITGHLCLKGLLVPFRETGQDLPECNSNILFAAEDEYLLKIFQYLKTLNKCNILP